MDDETARVARRVARSCLGMRVRLLNRVLSTIYDDALRPLGLSCAQLNLLVALGVRGRVPAAELGRLLRIEKSTLSRNLRRLTQERWITADPEIALAPAGADLLRRAMPGWRQAQRRARTLLGPAGARALARSAERARG
jgi:DNA-binding MarR family transcriptional regulator